MLCMILKVYFDYDVSAVWWDKVIIFKSYITYKLNISYLCYFIWPAAQQGNISTQNEASISYPLHQIQFSKGCFCSSNDYSNPNTIPLQKGLSVLF